MSNDWLANLKVGDEVIVDHGRKETMFNSEVIRLTATIVVISWHSKRFRKCNGKQSGQVYGAQIVEPTTERLDDIGHRKWADKLKLYKWEKESLLTLSKIVVILTEPREMK